MNTGNEITIKHQYFRPLLGCLENETKKCRKINRLQRKVLFSRIFFSFFLLFFSFSLASFVNIFIINLNVACKRSAGFNEDFNYNWRDLRMTFKQRKQEWKIKFGSKENNKFRRIKMNFWQMWGNGARYSSRSRTFETEIRVETKYLWYVTIRVEGWSPCS